MKVRIAAFGVRHSIPRALISAAAETAMRAARCSPDAEVDVALVDDATIARLNRRHLGHHGPTDVLAFPGTGQAGDRTIGEVVVSLDRAREQAREAGWPLRHEVALLVVHGVLHLRGYDDRTPQDSARMRAAEHRVLRRLQGAGF